MKEEIIKQYVGKQVKIFLKTLQRQYTATILKLESGAVTIRDKYGKVVPIDCDMIGLIEDTYYDDEDRTDGDVTMEKGGSFG